ncbi:sensor histidine kinase [Cupriavidus pauculus]|uniref:sensor histidine kinase n=1 Tax=Cupriavidus pauculus TaxID=82633 RepID=UPI001FD1701C|nr:ATP-binding protein [Cupriavidus pauculus]
MLAEEEAPQQPAASARLPDAEIAGQGQLHANRLALLGRCMAMIVHDAVQPVASVATRGQSALRWLRHDPPNIAAATASLERLVADAQRAAAVLAELGALASPAPRPRQPLRIDALLRDTLHWMEDDLRRQGIDVMLDIPDQGIVVMAERAALHQLFVNLIVNAMQAMSNTPLHARQLTARLSTCAGEAVAMISDRGCGFSAEAAPRLFEAFYTTKDDGMGVGLAICRHIATSHGGAIRAESRRTGGARFVVSLPLADQAACCTLAR